MAKRIVFNEEARKVVSGIAAIVIGERRAKLSVRIGINQYVGVQRGIVGVRLLVIRRL